MAVIKSATDIRQCRDRRKDPIGNRRATYRHPGGRHEVHGEGAPITDPRCGRNGATQVPIPAITIIARKNTGPVNRPSFAPRFDIHRPSSSNHQPFLRQQPFKSLSVFVSPAGVAQSSVGP
jgi:hypothetical protein